MVAVDDRQCPDAAADPGICSARIRSFRVPAMDVEQRRDDLEIVLHAVMDFADQAPLTLEGCGYFALGFFSSIDRASKCIAQLLDLFAWSELARKLEFAL